MSDAHSIEEINKHVRKYLSVFAALLFLTIITVGVSYFRLPIAQAVILALFIAAIKGTLVAGFFMHLFDEFKEKKPVLFTSLLLSVIGFCLVIFLPLFSYLNRLGQH